MSTGEPNALIETDPDWAPSQKLGHERSKPPDVDRFRRVQEREAKKKASLQGIAAKKQVKVSSLQLAPSFSPIESCYK